MQMHRNRTLSFLASPRVRGEAGSHRQMRDG